MSIEYVPGFNALDSAVDYSQDEDETKLAALELDDIIDRLIRHQSIDGGEKSVAHAMKTLSWTSFAMREFGLYKSALAMNCPKSLGDYMYEHTLTPSELGKVYEEEVALKIKEFVDSQLLQEKIAEIQAVCERHRQELIQCGCQDMVNIDWQVEQHRTWLMAKLESDTISPKRAQIRKAVAGEPQPYNPLPHVTDRYRQLTALSNAYDVCEQAGWDTQLAPLPLKDIVDMVLPSYRETDTRPKQLPNSAEDIDEFYLDHEFTRVARGLDSYTPQQFDRSYIGKLHKKASRYGNYTLGLFVPLTESANITPYHSARFNSLAMHSNADITDAIVWALLRIGAIRNGQSTMYDDEKVLIPDIIQSNAGPRRLIMSLYQTNKGSLAASRFGLAFDLIPESWGSCGLPELACIQPQR